MRPHLLWALLLLLAISGCAAQQPTGTGERTAVNVSRVIDGDTVEARPEVQGTEDVRLIGVDAPETANSPRAAQPYGEEAAEFAENELENRDVELRFDEEKVDDYGRALAYLYTPDGVMFNETLLEKGYAQVATFPPNVKHSQEFRRAQKKARRDERGLWSLPESRLCELTDRGNDAGGGC